MPPQTRTRGTKTLKENIAVETISKNVKKSTKHTRKALADKTNSLSDDSTEVPNKAKKPSTVSENVIGNNLKSRRDRRLPKRFIENKLLKNLSNSRDTSTTEPGTVQVSKIDIVTSDKKPTEPINYDTPTKSKSKKHVQLKKTSKSDIPSPHKTPLKDLESSLIINRPKRIHKLPSRFEDHTISPNKLIPVQPCHASTPLLKKTQSIDTKVLKGKPKASKSAKILTASSIDTLNKKNDESSNKSSPDSNNNPKKIKSVRLKAKAINNKNKSPRIGPTSKTNADLGKRLLDKSISFKVLEDKQSKDKEDKDLDVYEFTYDPDDEPPPQKKKRKRVVRKKSPKPKITKNNIIYKNNYNDNVSKALTALKNMISKKPQKSENQIKSKLQNKDTIMNIVTAKPTQSDIDGDNNCVPKAPVIQQKLPQISTNKEQNAPHNQTQIEPNVMSNISTNLPVMDLVKNTVHEMNYPSIRIEDIAADFETSDNADDLNYSPVNSPSHPVTPQVTNEFLGAVVNKKDPLNLQGDISFFDEQPVASSSMNASIRHPLASPWRVEFGSLPIKWQVNTYVKPNMTPAVESSFISSETNNQKKHVYTNMIPNCNNSLPQIDNNQSNLKQTSIISFIKEVAERSASKKRRGVSVTPTKANSLFEDITNTTHISKPALRLDKNSGNKEVTPNKNESNSSNESKDKENSRDNRKRKNDNKLSEVPARSPRQQRKKDYTYFGFDDSENQDQENVSPSKHIHNLRVRALKPRAQTILQELNRQTGPTRAPLPVAAKSKKATSSEAVNRVYTELKSAEEAPILLDKKCAQNTENTNIDPSINNEDSESVHLFEDIDFAHHLKPTRKSYGKAKKVTFQKKADSDSDVQFSDSANQSEVSDVDDLADLTFAMPTIKEKRTIKKKKTKKKMSKKEEQEVEAWAAGFNSMCEDVEEFPLMVE